MKVFSLTYTSGECDHGPVLREAGPHQPSGFPSRRRSRLPNRLRSPLRSRRRLPGADQNPSAELSAAPGPVPTADDDRTYCGTGSCLD